MASTRPCTRSFASRRWLFRALTLLLVTACVEGASHLLYRTVEGRWLSREALEALAAERESIATGDLAFPPETGKRSPYALHPYLGFVYNPDVNSPGFTAFHKNPISDFGLIDSQSPLRHRSEGSVIVGIFGGSVAYYLSTEGIDVLIARLGQAPAYRGKKVAIVRVALGGWRQPQQLMALNYLLALGGELDIVVNIDGFNEVTQYAGVAPKERSFFVYPASWSRLAASVPQHRALEGEMAFVREARRRWARLGSRSHLRLSATANLVWRRGDRLLQDRLTRDERELAARLSEGSRPYALTGPSLRHGNDARLHEDLVKLWKRSSLQMAHLCRANGIRYYHFLQPSRYLPGSKPLTREEEALAFPPNHPYRVSVQRAYPLLRSEGEGLRAAGVRFSDLCDTFASMTDAAYKDSCCHLTPLGNRVMADAIADAILSDPP